MMAQEPLESELKIPVTDLQPIRASLRAARAVKVQSVARETNVLLDSDDGRLRNAGSLLRLRKHGDRKLLTFKGPVSYRGAVKERPEYETEIADLERMSDILGLVGFSIFMRYEKEREEWLLGEVSVVLDQTPMGDFVEVEGPPEQLEQTALVLGLDTADAVRGSYLSLWQEYRERHPELNLPCDMVFTE